MGIKKLTGLLLAGFLFGMGTLGAQTQELKVFLEDYWKVTSNFAAAMEKASTPGAVKKAVGDFSTGMKPLVLKAQQLEKKYSHWGPALLEGNTPWEKDWSAKFAQVTTRLSNALMKVYQLGMDDPALLEALETMSEDMEKIWPSGGEEQEED